MIIDCISDLHGHYPTLEGGDLLIVAGDLTARHTKKEFAEFAEWYQEQDYFHKVLIAGNHDGPIQTGDYYFNHDWMGYLCDSGCEIEIEEERETKWGTKRFPTSRKLKVWGSPWTAQFPGINPNCCAFTVPYLPPKDFKFPLKHYWDMIPDDTDILVTHSPPYGTFDQVGVEYGASVGCMELRNASQDRVRPLLHVFGHIHEHGGKRLNYKRPGHGTENNTIYVNASHVDERYRPVNKTVRIILEGKPVFQKAENGMG